MGDEDRREKAEELFARLEEPHGEDEAEAGEELREFVSDLLDRMEGEGVRLGRRITEHLYREFVEHGDEGAVGDIYIHEDCLRIDARSTNRDDLVIPLDALRRTHQTPEEGEGDE